MADNPGVSIYGVANANAVAGISANQLVPARMTLGGELAVAANITAVAGNISLAAFQPLSGNAPSVTAAVANTSAQLNIPALPATNPTLRVTIDGTQTVAWAYGNVTATMNGSVQMLANTSELFAAPAGLAQISHIGQAAGSNIRVTVGSGGS